MQFNQTSLSREIRYNQPRVGCITRYAQIGQTRHAFEEINRHFNTSSSGVGSIGSDKRELLELRNPIEIRPAAETIGRGESESLQVRQSRQTSRRGQITSSSSKAHSKSREIRHRQETIVCLNSGSCRDSKDAAP